MGQYYKCHLVTEKGKVRVYTPGVKLEDGTEGSFEGYKLMEHSWWKNDFVSAIANILTTTKAYVSWCGDYAEEYETVRLGFHYHTVWPKYDEDDKKQVKNKYPKKAPADFTLKGKYLVNHSKKEYLDLDKYYAKFEADGGDWCVHPLPLLTVIGNGRGGGDYHECYPCFQHTGIWAGNLLSIDEAIPEGYTEFETYFTEKVKNPNSNSGSLSTHYYLKVTEILNQIRTAYREGKKSGASDWTLGVYLYAIDLGNNLYEFVRSAPDNLWDDPDVLEKFLLRGEESWETYSNNGFSLTWVEDIADRLGLNVESWCLKQQAKALAEAANVVKDILKQNK